jgi:endonuclease YncB( thermonuclease family)
LPRIYERFRLAFRSLVVVGVGALAWPLAAKNTSTPACELQSGGRAAVVGVLDAETVLLDDDRQVRLIGALAPRSPDLRSEAVPWPPEQRATAALSGLVLGQTVELAYAGRRRDRYGRRLAHLFVERGGARVWVQGRLLSAGHARAYGLPGSFACMRELIAHERAARDPGTGLWSNAAYAARAAHKTRALMRHRNSYQIVTGTVADVAQTKARTYLNFGSDWRSDFTAGIDKKVLSKHPGWAATLAQLAGRRVEVRGWIEYRNGPYINIEDPHQIAEAVEATPAPSAPPRGPTMSSGQERANPPGKEKHPAREEPGALDL